MMKRITALVLCLLLVVATLFSASVSAADSTRLLGDVDGNDDVESIDVTWLQRHLASIVVLDDTQLSYADVDLNDEVEVIDVTMIQRWLVDIPTESYLGMTLKQAQQEKLRPEIEEQIKNYTPQKGVDISAHNGDVDMNKLKEAGFTFVMIRLGYGSDYTSQDDIWFERNVQKAEAAGLDWGAYLYSYALTVDGVYGEINHTLRLLEGKHPTMPIAFDMEDDSYKEKYGMPTNTVLQNICMTYLAGIKDAGYYPVLYSNYNWLTNKLNNPQLLDNYDLWYAQWYTVMQYDASKVGIWQYGGETNYIDTPYIDGLDGMFDKDICYKNYPVIITAYGYNNHEAILESQVASTGAGWTPYDCEQELIPEEYADGVMGDSLR